MRLNRRSVNKICMCGECDRERERKKWFDGSDENHRSIRNGIYGIEYKVISHFMFEPFRRPFNPSVPSLFETCFANIFRIPFVLPPNTHPHRQPHAPVHMCVCAVRKHFNNSFFSLSRCFFMCFFPIKFQSRAKIIIIIVINGFLQCKRNIPSL